MKYIFCVLNFFLFLSSCSGQNKQDSVISSVDKVSLKAVNVQRFDKDLKRYLDNPSQDEERLLKARYENFLPAFGRITINNSDSFKPEFYKRLQRYFSNEMLVQIYQASLDKFADIADIESELSVADNLIYQNFNGKRLPALYMHVSGFKENVMVMDNAISLSIDKYLGQDFVGYKQFFEPYLLEQMQPEMVSRDYLKAWLLSENQLNGDDKKDLLSAMIYEGKILYALSQLLPQKAPELLIGYTPEQLAWCNENEKKVWLFIIEQNHLYSTDNLLIQKYTTESPYTTPVSAESPGRLGAWVGWKIVKVYMEKSNMSLSDLFNAKPQDVLKASFYNPE